MLPTAPEAPMIEMLVDMPELCEGFLPHVKGYKLWTKTSPTLGWRNVLNR